MAQAVAKSRLSAEVIRRNVNGWLFVAPWLLGFLIFTLYPLIASLYYSFTDYNIIQTPKWIGLQNYTDLFMHDSLFWIAVGNTLFYVAAYVPLSIGASVAVAMLLNLRISGQGIYRTLIFLPVVVPEVVTGMLWFWMLNPRFGFANTLLTAFGLPRLNWLGDPGWAKPSLILIALWGIGNSVVIYLAALQDVPQELYESASIDGAGAWGKTRYVTLPMITPTILFNLVLGIIGSMQSFTSVYIITKGTGGPVDSTLFYGLLIYRNAFDYLKMGYASALAWLLFLLILGITLLVFKTSGRWVFYSGGEAR